MISKIARAEIEKKIDYQFSDTSLLELALSHRSVGAKNNERLEFLGDSLLGLIIAEALFEKFPKLQEGKLSPMRSHLVRGETLAALMRDMKLEGHVLLGGGELKSGGHRRASIQADVIEALIGAVYLDSDFETCKLKVLQWFEARLSALKDTQVTKDPKTRLQEYMQTRNKNVPRYTVIAETGESHAREYQVECAIFSDSQRFQGRSTSKRGAEKVAAAEALKYLGVPSDES